MIIKVLTKSDTYVTNLNTQNIKGVNSNFGRASTLDLFKVYNENKYSHSKAFIDFDTTQSINNGSRIELVDASQTTLIFEFNTGVNFANSSFDNEETIYTIGIQDKTGTDYTQIIAESINSIADAGNIKIDAFYTQDELVLVQKEKGELGDTEFKIADISAVATSKVEKTNDKDYFSRIDWSAILIKLDFNLLTNNWANNGLTGSFTSGDFSAKLVLKDVSTGLSKPRSYDIVCYKMNKAFDEGIGKDTAQLTDLYTANFNKLNNSESWAISGYIAKGIDIDSTEISFFSVETGEEDVVLDVTSYVEGVISGDEDHGLLITFSDEILFNKKSYFAKRFGSNHLLKKSLVPTLNVNINDAKYRVSNSDFFKKEYKISSESLDFYVVKDRNKIQSQFVYPTGYDQISHELTETDGTAIIEKTNASQLTDLKGNSIPGVLKNSITIAGTNILLPEYFENASLNKGKVKAKSKWYYSDSNDILEDLLIKSEDIELIYHDNESKTNEDNLYVAINFDKNLTANNTDYKMTVYFIDLKEKVSASRVKYNLLSKDLGDVFYRIKDKNTGKIIVDLNDNDYQNATKLRYNGESYEANIFISELFKSNVLEIEFAYKDILGNLSFLKNNSLGFRVG